MSIPVSSIVNVSISVAPNFPEREGFGTLCGITTETGVIGVAERIRLYNDIAGVAADWPTNTELYALAQTYFSQNPRPTMFKAAIRFPTAQPPQLRGGAISDVTTLAAITDGAFNISIGGENAEITGLDFSAIPILDRASVAFAVETALQTIGTGPYLTATCTVEDDTRLVINGGEAGSAHEISFAVAPASGTDVHELLHFEQGEATKQNGIDAEDITASLSAIEAVDQDWYGFMFTREMRDKTMVGGSLGVVDASDWAQSRTKIFFNATNDIDALDSVSNVNTIGATLDTATLDRTLTVFSSYPKQYPACSAAGRIFTTDFAATNSVITLKFKQLPSITTEDLNPTQKAALDKYHVNALINVGGSTIFAEGWNHSGRFTDEIHALDWLTDAIQKNVFGKLYTDTTKTAFTDAGIASIEQKIASALDEARNNGFIAPGYTADDRFLERGYEITMPLARNVNRSDKDARHLPGVSFIILGAGALHSIQISGTFER